MRRLPLAALAFVIALGCLYGCTVNRYSAWILPSNYGAKDIPTGSVRKLGAGTLPDRFSSFAGTTAATVTVPAGKYVTGVAMQGTGTTTLTVTPCGPSIATCTAQTAYTVPAGQFSLTSPTLRGAPNEWADGTTLVFAGASLTSYVVTCWQYNP